MNPITYLKKNDNNEYTMQGNTDQHKFAKEEMLGDHLSLFSFIIVVDVLSKILDRAKEEGMIRGFMIGSDRVEISDLQFPNDTLYCWMSMGFMLIKRED